MLSASHCTPAEKDALAFPQSHAGSQSERHIGLVWLFKAPQNLRFAVGGGPSAPKYKAPRRDSDSVHLLPLIILPITA